MYHVIVAIGLPIACDRVITRLAIQNDGSINCYLIIYRENMCHPIIDVVEYIIARWVTIVPLMFLYALSIYIAF